jgi:hypothetical protein
VVEAVCADGVTVVDGGGVVRLGLAFGGLDVLVGVFAFVVEAPEAEEGHGLSFLMCAVPMRGPKL